MYVRIFLRNILIQVWHLGLSVKFETEYKLRNDALKKCLCMYFYFNFAGVSDKQIRIGTSIAHYSN